MFDALRNKRHMNKLIDRRDMRFKIDRLEETLHHQTQNNVAMGRRINAVVRDRNSVLSQCQRLSLDNQILTEEVDALNGIINDLREALSASQRAQGRLDTSIRP